MNFPMAYNVRPNISEPFTPILSIMNPLMVRPNVKRQHAEIQNKIPASDGVILYSY